MWLSSLLCYLLFCDDIIPIIGLNWMVDGKTSRMACEENWGKSYDLNPLLQLWLLVSTNDVVLNYTLL